MTINSHALAVASSNAGKLAELRNLLDQEIALRSLAELGLDSPDETGLTFEQNAILKARHVHDRTGLVVLADDSGIEVDALGGNPGVRSARFAGVDATDADNRALLLTSLRDIDPNHRGARFVCVIAIVSRDGAVATTRGTCEGTISFEERGSNGFGYDALFMLPDGRTMAELTPEEKNHISHRSRAIRLAIPLIYDALESFGG